MFITQNGVVKLGDYALPLQEDYSKLKVEELWYMAPEALKRKEGPKSDVWSLGISLIELAEGQNPYTGCTAVKVMRLVCDGQPPALSSSKWSAEFVDFVNKCLVKDVKERWSVKQLMNVSVVLRG